MKKKLTFLVLLASLLVGCTAPEPQPMMFKLVGSEPDNFPAVVTVDYFISNKATGLVGDNHYVALADDKYNRFHQLNIYPVEKKKDGYIVHDSEHKDYTLPNPKEFGYSEVYLLDKQNGQIKIVFQHENQYRGFFEGFNTKETDGSLIGMERVCKYYDCYKEK